MTTPSRAAVRIDDVRRHNLSALLRQVHLHGDLSRAELTNLLGLNRSTIGALVNDLVERGLVTEHIPTTGARAGRPSHMVAPRQPGPFVLAASVGVGLLVTAAIGLGGTVLSRREHDTEGAAGLPDAVAGQIAADLKLHQRTLPAGSSVAAVGISVPGVVRTADGVVEVAPNLRWRNVELAEILTRRLGRRIPIRIGNDGNLGALAEHERGAGRGESDIVFVAGDVGVGGGIMVDGRMLQGAGGYAGEIGHFTLDPSGPPCQCGSRGCLEAMVGSAALLRACGRSTEHSSQAMRELLAAADAGDAEVRAGMQVVAERLGWGLANMVNVFNPHVLIVGGNLAGIVDRCRPTIESQLDKHAMAALRRGVDLRLPGLGVDSSLFGAMEIAFADLLDDPTLPLVSVG